MEKLKYALYHGKYFLIFLLIGIYFLSSFVLNTVTQLNSAKNGIEMLFIDTTLSSGSPDSFASSVKKATGVKYVSASTLATNDALEYIKTIDNYTFTDYLAYLAEAKDLEVIFVNETYLKDAIILENAVPLDFYGTFPESCYRDGVLYALMITNTYVTSYGSTVVSLQENTYAVLLDGDHVDEMRQFFINTFLEG